MPLTNIDIRRLFVIPRFSHGKCLLKGSTSLTRGLVYMTTGLGFEPLSYPTPQGIWRFHQFFRLLHRESILLHNLNDFQSMKPPYCLVDVNESLSWESRVKFKAAQILCSSIPQEIFILGKTEMFWMKLQLLSYNCEAPIWWAWKGKIQPSII